MQGMHIDVLTLSLLTLTVVIHFDTKDDAG